MKTVIQRVLSAKVVSDQKKVASIGAGCIIFVGFHKEDSQDLLGPAVKKIIELRYFEDKEGKMNRSLLDVKGEMLVVSQFTLMAATKRGRRPDFFEAMEPKRANDFFDQFIEKMQAFVPVQQGIFGANMQVHIVNDGPVTFYLEF